MIGLCARRTVGVSRLGEGTVRRLTAALLALLGLLAYLGAKNARLVRAAFSHDALRR